jgi:8-oxo-dGTP pyrophosphatase MutT (NUDIX family)
MSEKLIARGQIFELVHLPQTDGRVFEVARRAPGVRVIIADRKRGEVLLTKEHRWELGGLDYRLPGGKVFDTLEAFDKHRKAKADILQAATAKAKEEAAEEAGIQIDELKLVNKSSLGATIEWDLYVFEATRWQSHPQGQNLKEDEQQGIEVAMYPYAEVEKLILRGDLQEERIALILLRWLKKQAAKV